MILNVSEEEINEHRNIEAMVSNDKRMNKYDTNSNNSICLMLIGRVRTSCSLCMKQNLHLQLLEGKKCT